jgi:hypothetical protein
MEHPHPSWTELSRRVLPFAILAVFALAGGLVLGAGRVDEARRETASVRASASAVASQAAVVRGERNRLRAERNQLEARLAAGKVPALCPQPYVSTGTAGLDPLFAVDYPCGWHVLRDARPGDTADPNRPGLRVEVTFFSRLPISFAPKTGPLADIELQNWADDPASDGDELPTIDRWVSEEKALFAAGFKSTRFAGGSGIEVRQIAGTQTINEEPTPVSVLVWEFDDTLTGARHIVRVFSVASGDKTREALVRMARSFSIPQR